MIWAGFLNGLENVLEVKAYWKTNTKHLKPVCSFCNHDKRIMIPHRFTIQISEIDPRGDFARRIRCSGSKVLNSFI